VHRQSRIGLGALSGKPLQGTSTSPSRSTAMALELVSKLSA
jgi:hypothetical protein